MATSLLCGLCYSSIVTKRTLDSNSHDCVSLIDSTSNYDVYKRLKSEQCMLLLKFTRTYDVLTVQHVQLQLYSTYVYRWEDHDSGAKQSGRQCHV